MHTYEVEIKSLLGSKENADALREKLRAEGLKEKGGHSQLNHYFNEPEKRDALLEAIMPLVLEEKHDALKRILGEGKNISVRTRDADGTVLVVVKASIGDDSSANGVKRIEFEEKVDKTLDELDQVLLDAGLTYQAKWSRQREEYAGKDVTVTIDKNAGYGYVAEFEKMTDSSEKAESIREELLSLMKGMGVAELPQDRLERMFDFYNTHWDEYYGTDNIFTIE